MFDVSSQHHIHQSISFILLNSVLINFLLKILDYYFEEVQDLRFVVYDVDKDSKDLIGEVISFSYLLNLLSSLSIVLTISSYLSPLSFYPYK